MDTTTIWNTSDLRTEWAKALTPKLVDYFERFINARNPDAFKTKRQHHDDTQIPLKHIDREDGSLVTFLEAAGLIRLERQGELFKVTPVIPVSVSPPSELHLPLYASLEGTRRPVNRRRIYDLDGGICSYCEVKVDLENCQIDHIYPFNKGGADDEENLTLQCSKCDGKWHFVPGQERFRGPVRFRGKRVKSVKFIERGDYKYPEFEFEDR